jgi:hypothetical protein
VLYGDSCNSPYHCTAVGYYLALNTRIETLAESR